MSELQCLVSASTFKLLLSQICSATSSDNCLKSYIYQYTNHKEPYTELWKEFSKQMQGMQQVLVPGVVTMPLSDHSALANFVPLGALSPFLICLALMLLICGAKEAAPELPKPRTIGAYGHCLKAQAPPSPVPPPIPHRWSANIHPS